MCVLSIAAIERHRDSCRILLNDTTTLHACNVTQARWCWSTYRHLSRPWSAFLNETGVLDRLLECSMKILTCYEKIELSVGAA